MKKADSVDAVTPSDELIAVTRRWMAALEAKNGPILVALFSGSDALRYVGTDRDEFFTGRLLRDGYPQHVQELPPFRHYCEELEAFARGDIGWAIWLGEVHFLERDERSRYRFSFVFTLESGIWKIVHVHVSNPRSNLEVWGGEHQVFQRLMQAAKAEGHIFGVEGTATIMFTDIANSTSLAAFVGDRAWANAIGRHFAQVRTIVGSFEGVVVKTLGDGTMSSFGSALAAMQAALVIQAAIAESCRDPAFQIRIGMHTGDVVQAEGDFFGSVVNKAARIAAIADPGAILVSEETRAMAGGGAAFEFGPPQPVRLQGIEGTPSVSRLLRAG